MTGDEWSAWQGAGQISSDSPVNSYAATASGPGSTLHWHARRGQAVPDGRRRRLGPGDAVRSLNAGKVVAYVDVPASSSISRTLSGLSVSMANV